MEESAVDYKQTWRGLVVTHPKSGVVRWAKEDSGYWYVQCRHTFAEPLAPDHNVSGLHEFVELIELLKCSNGADIFEVARVFPLDEGYGKIWLPRYQVLNFSGIDEAIRKLTKRYWQTFPESGTKKVPLDYLPFCDLKDGNFLCLNSIDQSVILVNYDLAYPPISELLSGEAYPSLAPSLTDWLDLLIQSNGWSGVGGKLIPM